MSRTGENKLVEKWVPTGYECDCCHKKVSSGDLPKGWKSFSAGHGEWGNDSHESYNNYDVCSFYCYVSLFTEEYERLKDEDSGVIDHCDMTYAGSLVTYIKTAWNE